MTKQQIKTATAGAIGASLYYLPGETDEAKRETVIQEGDVLHLVMREENAGNVYAVFKKGPEAD